MNTYLIILYYNKKKYTKKNIKHHLNVFDI